MKRRIFGASLALTVGFVAATPALAADVDVTADIAASTTWTANNVYNLKSNTIYILPGATLTIEAGTVVASDTGGGGALVCTRGAQIFVQGTAQDPVIMTSQADRATWTAGDPKTGVWRESANEWGNLTVCGQAFISENETPGNTPTCNAANVGTMEGLVEGFPGDPRILYGGGNDDDDSGSIKYLSLRYGGKVQSLNKELNGLSLGGIGRGTDIHHVEVMNNVDDGIEIWGGTVNLKYVSIWNVGDDSFDIDQGWRGKAQFGLIVQGHSLDTSQGGGVGDNCFETDGAEDSDYQPVTTTSIYNFTVVGQPADGDCGTTWRDNARVQYRNCVFMDLGDELVCFDNVDGDGAHGYGFNGTLSWAATWTTDYDMVPAHANDCPAGTYTVQQDGKLAEIKGSVFFRNLKGGAVGTGYGDAAYATAVTVGVNAGGNSNILTAGFADVDAPVTSVMRSGPVVKGGKTMLPVTFLDPRPANAALTASPFVAPADGFFTPVSYRGGFEPGTAIDETWISSWTASSAFGFTTLRGDDPYTGFCFCDGVKNSGPCGNNSAFGDEEGCLNSQGFGAKLIASGSNSLAQQGVDELVLHVTQGRPNKNYVVLQGAGAPPQSSFRDGLLCVGNPTLRLPGFGCGPVPIGTFDSAGATSTDDPIQGFGIVAADTCKGGTIASQVAGVGSATRDYQVWFRDAMGPCGTGSNLTNAIEVVWQP